MSIPDPVSVSRAAHPSRRAVSAHEEAAALSQQLLDASRQQGTANMELLARDVAKLAELDPDRASHVLAELAPALDPHDRQRLFAEVERLQPELLSTAPRQGPSADELVERKRELALDLTQMGLAIAGIFDPTPISDGADGLISLFRGDLLGAGISAVSMIPYVGDAAKLGKLPKFARTIENAVDLAKADPRFLEQIRPALEKIRDAVKAVPLDQLPDSAREPLETIARKIDEVLSPALRVVSRNGYDYTLDGGNRVTKVEGTLQLDRTAPRNPRAQLEAGGPDRLPDDQGGHYIARIFKGPVDDFNHFAQNGNFNMGAYRSLERRWDELLQDGRQVRVEITPKYVGDSLRPDSLKVKYWIDGVPQDPINFRNAPGGK